MLVKKDSGITVTKGEMHTDEFRIAHEAGRAAKYHVNANWSTELVVYVTYGQAGGAKKDKAKTNEIMEANRKEMQHDRHGNQLILGDFNAEPNSLDISRELIEDEGRRPSGGGERRTSALAKLAPKRNPHALMAF